MLCVLPHADIQAQPAQNSAGQIMASEIARLEQSIAKHEAEPRANPPNAAKEMQHLLALVQLASLYVQANRIADSWPLQERILRRMEALVGPDHANLVGPLEGVASVYALQERYAEADKLRKRAVAIAERSFGADSLEVATSLQGMAHLFRLQDRDDEALAFATRAMAIADRKLPRDDPRRIPFVTELAEAQIRAKRYPVAEQLLRDALAGAEKTKAGQQKYLASVQAAQLLQSLSLVVAAQGRHDEAATYIDRAIALSTNALGRDHFMTAAMLMTLATQLADRSQLEAATQMLQKASPLVDSSSPFAAVRADYKTSLGLIAYISKNWRDAYANLGAASQMYVELEKISGAGGIAPSTNRAAPRADIHLLAAAAAYRTAEAAPGDAAVLRDSAFQLAQRAERSTVGRALAEMSARIAARDDRLKALIRKRQDLAQEWQQLDKELEKALAAPAAERNAQRETGMRKRLSEIAVELDAIDARARSQMPQLAKITDPAPLAIADVQRLLRPREVLISIVHRQKDSLVWGISRDAAEWRLVPVGETQVKEQVATLRCGLDKTAWYDDGATRCAALTGSSWNEDNGGDLPFRLDTAHELYAQFLQPFEAMTQGAEVILATSGPLGALPLHVLITEKPAAATTEGEGYAKAAWFAKRNASTFLPSVASLQALRSTAVPSHASRPYLGVGNPLLSGPDDRFAVRARAAQMISSCQSPLAVAGQAAETRSLHTPTVPLADLAAGVATTERIRQLSPLPETAIELCAVSRDLGADDSDVHLGARATETAIKQSSTAGQLAQFKVVHFATHGALAGQMTATSEPGLILTPPKSATTVDDGYLTASEIAALKLDADWVILSACNTAGAGSTGAETLSGLARAFFYAQARTVLASHWEVESQTTVRLVGNLALSLRRAPDAGRAEALRQALLPLIADAATAHPGSWAPFVVVGEGG